MIVLPGVGDIDAEGDFILQRGRQGRNGKGRRVGSLDREQKGQPAGVGVGGSRGASPSQVRNRFSPLESEEESLEVSGKPSSACIPSVLSEVTQRGL